jgi:hypothetical protein
MPKGTLIHFNPFWFHWPGLVPFLNSDALRRWITLVRPGGEFSALLQPGSFPRRVLWRPDSVPGLIRLRNPGESI